MSRVPPVQADWIEAARRPDSELPPELRHEKIREVRDRSGPTMQAYQVVFDQSWMPYGYLRGVEDWSIDYARTEWLPKTDGLLGKLLPGDPCIVIVVSREIDPDPFGHTKDP